MGSLYDFLSKTREGTYDTVDPKCDFILIVAYIPEDKAHTEYEKFCVNIEKKVEAGSDDNGMVIAHWSDFIQDNIMIFRSFAQQVWKIDPFMSDFFDECLRRIHNMMAGKYDEKEYSEMNELLNACE